MRAKSILNLILAVLSCSILSLSAIAQQDTLIKPKYNGWSSHNLKGAVKEMTSTSYAIDPKTRRANPKLQEGLTQHFVFDSSGTELKYELINQQGRLEAVSAPQYAMGKIVSTTTQVFYPAAYTEYWIVKAHALDFYPAVAEYYEDNTLIKKVVNTVDTQGHLTHMKLFNTEGKLIFEKTVDYDPQGNMTHTREQLQFPGKKDSTTVIRYQYLKADAQGNWTERLDHTNGRKTITKREIVYYK